MPVAFKAIEPLLLRVEKPARYLGGEYNQIVKEGPDVRVRCCLAFPDVYDLGMSYHGYALLYERLNRRAHWAAERAYTPWPDFDALLRETGLPLFSLETRRALSEFDVVGFTLQHEVNYTNILSMLDLGGVPIEAKDRTAPFPLIVGGGEGAYSPEPMSPFFDCFVIGDGEQAIEEIMEIAERAKDEAWSRERLLVELCRLQGVYVPEFYDVAYREDGQIASVKPNREGVPAVVRKCHYNVTEDEGAIRPPAPLLRTVHDRLAIEIRRGCTNGCRFCQAGMITRPVRERSVDQIVEIARKGIENTGYDEVSLLSLSSADYTAIGTLVRRMTREFGPNRVSVSLPSLRINAFDIDIADEIRGVRKSGFTFAPEAGTDRLRKVINKEVDEGEFFRIIEEVFARGWQTVKFYYMLGLPTETDVDLDGIVRATRHAAEIGRRHHGRKAIVNVTLSPFVPKSNTPFQWEAQPEPAELERRYQYVRRQLRDRNIDVRTADTRAAFVEAVLARADRRVAAALERAWELGCRFDGWEEYFRFDLWMRAFAETGIDPAWYANRERDEDEVLPFDHLDSNLGKRFLWADLRRSRRLRVMEDCAIGKCAGCVACGDTVDHILARDGPGATDGMERYGESVIRSRKEKSDRLDEGRSLEDPDEGSMLRAAANRYRERRERIAERDDAGAEEVFTRFQRRAATPQHRYAEPERAQRLRIAFTKLGVLRYLAHLDLAKTIAMTMRRARAPLSYSEGFNPKPRIAFAPPLPLGVGGLAEMTDVVLTERVDPEEFLARLNAKSIEGLKFVAAEEIDMTADSLDAAASASRFALDLDLAAFGLTREAAEDALEAFHRAETFPVQVAKKRATREIDLKRSIVEASLADSARAGRARFDLTIGHAEGEFVKPHVALAHVLGCPIELGPKLVVDRVQLLLAASATVA